MVVFFAREIIDAAIARLKSAIPASLTFNPKLIQSGDLSWYAENDQLALDLPAVYVWAPEVIVDVEGDTVLSGLTQTTTALRVAVADLWTEGLAVYPRRIAYLEEIAGKLLGTTGQAYDFGASIAGYQVIKAVPVRLQPKPEEDDAVSQDDTRRVWASAMDLMVVGRAVR